MATTVRALTALTSLQASDAVYIERSGAAVGNHVEMSNFGLDISAKVTHSASQSIATGVDTALAFDTEDYDTDAIHDTSTNNSRLTCQTSGKYWIWGLARFASNTTGFRQLAISLNGVTTIAVSKDGTSSGTAHLVIGVEYELSAADYVELIAQQTSGGPLNVERVTDFSPIFGMRRVSP